VYVAFVNTVVGKLMGHSSKEAKKSAQAYA